MPDDSPVIRERVLVPADEPVAERVSHTTTTVALSDADGRLAGLERATQLWWLLVGTVCALISLRFVLLLLGVNQENTVAQLLLTASQPLVAPFLTMFGSPAAGQAVMELPDLVAILTYTLVGVGFDRLLRLLFAPPDPTGNAYRSTI